MSNSTERRLGSCSTWSDNEDEREASELRDEEDHDSTFERLL